MNTEENKLIAEFMGVDIHEFVMNGGKKWEYHSSWDWLMPVVEKIETTLVSVPSNKMKGMMKNTQKANPILSTMYDGRPEFLGWTWCIDLWIVSLLIDDVKYKTKLEATYKAVVEFIKWYNEQKH